MIGGQVIERDDVVTPGQRPVERPSAGNQIVPVHRRR